MVEGPYAPQFFGSSKHQGPHWVAVNSAPEVMQVVLYKSCPELLSYEVAVWVVGRGFEAAESTKVTAGCPLLSSFERLPKKFEDAVTLVGSKWNRRRLQMAMDGTSRRG
jgi:hypothetical protein